MIALLRDPLVHFVAIGLLVFVLDGQRQPDPPAAPAPDASAPIIQVDAVLIQDIRAILTQELERLPTPTELNRGVEEWIDRELLVRAARVRGLDRGDPQIRARLAERMAFVLGAQAVPDTPSDATLRARYAAQRDAFTLPLQVTLRQCFAGSSKARAQALLAVAQAGASRDDLAARCDAPPGGPVLRGRSEARLVARYGASFVVDLATTPVGVWHLRESTLGWHVVRIEQRRDARVIDFEAARGRLISHWRQAQVDTARQAAIDALRERAVVRGWPR